MRVIPVSYKNVVGAGVDVDKGLQNKRANTPASHLADLLDLIFNQELWNNGAREGTVFTHQ